MLAVGLAAVGVVVATALTLRAFQNMMFFVDISEVVEGNAPTVEPRRRLVVAGSVERDG